jgi:hypothetical protein
MMRRGARRRSRDPQTYFTTRMKKLERPSCSPTTTWDANHFNPIFTSKTEGEFFSCILYVKFLLKETHWKSLHNLFEYLVTMDYLFQNHRFDPLISISFSKPLMSSGSKLTRHNWDLLFISS